MNEQVEKLKILKKEITDPRFIEIIDKKIEKLEQKDVKKNAKP